MSRAAMSIWPLSAPCRAQVGSAWCRLCQDSPKEAMASQGTLTERSRDCQSVLPQVWQIELIDQVTWCSRVTRTRLAQKNASMAACQEKTPAEVQKPPMTAGPRRGKAAMAGKSLLTVWMLLSPSRSGANFSFEVSFGSNSHVTCAQTSPLASAFALSPYRQGECGSPSLSLYLWCLRWSATQVMTGPWIARLPATASATRRPDLALNELCVKYRWKPMVMPSPEIQ